MSTIGRIFGRNSAPVAAKPAETNSAAAKSGLDLSFLERSNPQLKRIISENPGVEKFLKKNVQAIAKPQAGDVQTSFSWPVWTHSPASAGLTKDNEKDIIVVWQETPGSKSKVDFGGWNSYAGEIIAVHRVDLRDNGPVRPATAIDKGYIWPNMKVTATGKAGQKLKMQWAVVTIDANGNVRGGGYPAGYAGRTHEGQHGKADYIPLKG